MTKGTKQTVLDLAKQMGASVNYGKGVHADGLFEITIDAPRGQHWVSGSLHQLVESQSGKERLSGRASVEALWRDALERMQEGLEECDPDDSDCQDAD